MGISIIKKLSLSLLVFCGVVFTFGIAASAEEVTQKESEPIHIEETFDLNKLEYRDVSEEEVILDYMFGKNVDRYTAIKELGIDQKKKYPCIL